MALSITSPGVQINEKDLSLRANLPVGTNVVVAGFAAQGPSSEPLLISSVSELEATYGTPTTAAERYFYYSAREILNSPGTLTTIRLPYGENAGADFSLAYSALVYPADEDNGNWEIGAPSHVNLTEAQYTSINEGNFMWELSSHGGVAFDGDEVKLRGAFVILNDLQTSINELAEGYYIGFADNTGTSDLSSSYDALVFAKTLSDSTGVFATLNTTKLETTLTSAVSAYYSSTSVSELLQSVGFSSFSTNEYADHLSLGVFKLRRSTADSGVLSVISVEKYLGSFDSNRQQVSPTGGILANAFIEDVVNNGSATIKLHINPSVSTSSWATSTTSDRKQLSVGSGAKGLFPLGSYVANATSLASTKIIGNVPLKLDKVLRTVESVENTSVDVIIDGGLSTIFAYAEYNGGADFIEDQYIPSSDFADIKEYWSDVAIEFVNFAENTRKDCVAILDPSRNIFISGKSSKVADSSSKTFTQDIFAPLKAQAEQFSTNYCAMYGNWVKANDVFTGKNIWVPFSGYAAAVFARNDSVAQPWSAPGGLNRGNFNAIDIAFNPNQKQRDKFYEISVNPVVFFAGDGYAVYGQKTLQTKPTAFDRINVRRLFLALERSVARSVKYFVFEPNTDFTRTRLRNTIAPIFNYAKNTEGLYDYLIVCDERNNPADIIDQNQLIVDIYIKPVRTAEFILVNFIATRTGQNFTELL